jgi:hypothetical protein
MSVGGAGDGGEWGRRAFQPVRVCEQQRNGVGESVVADGGAVVMTFGVESRVTQSTRGGGGSAVTLRIGVIARPTFVHE